MNSSFSPEYCCLCLLHRFLSQLIISSPQILESFTLFIAYSFPPAQYVPSSPMSTFLFPKLRLSQAMMKNILHSYHTSIYTSTFVTIPNLKTISPMAGIRWDLDVMVVDFVQLRNVGKDCDYSECSRDKALRQTWGNIDYAVKWYLHVCHAAGLAFGLLQRTKIQSVLSYPKLGYITQVLAQYTIC